MAGKAHPGGLPTIRQVLSRGHLRLVLFAVLLLAGALLVSSLLLMRGHVASNLQLTARTVAYSVEPAVYFGNAEAVREAIASVGASGNARRIEVLDAQGTVLAAWGAAQDAGPQAAIDGLVWPRPVAEPIRNGSIAVGEVRIFGSAAQLVRFVIACLVIVLCCLGLAFIATRILARQLEEEVLGPLDRVAEIAEVVGRDRDFARRVGPSGLAEIDRFARGFNVLLGELQRWHNSVTSENAALMHQAEHDALTGLGNRIRFERRLDEAIEQADRLNSPFVVLFIDVDRFKQVNDTHGHLSGDAVLREIAARLRGVLRQDDEAFRVGGDEFAILLIPARRSDATATLIERIQQAIEQPVALRGDRSIEVGVSIGRALYPDQGKSAGSLLSWADRAMYQRKKERRDDV